MPDNYNCKYIKLERFKSVSYGAFFEVYVWNDQEINNGISK